MKQSLNKIFFLIILYLVSCSSPIQKNELSIKWSKGVDSLLRDTTKFKPVFDSIKNLVITSASDTNAIIFLNQLAAASNGTVNKILAEEAINQSKKVAYKRGELAGMCWLSVYHGRRSEFEEAEKLLIQSLSIARTNKYLDVIIMDLRWLATMHRFMVEDKKALSEYYEALNLSLKFNYENDLDFIYPNLGVMYLGLDKPDSSKILLEKGLKYAIAKNNKTMISFCYLNIGRVYEVRNEINTSLEYNLKAVKIAEEGKDKPRMAEIYSLIGSLYSLNNQSEKSYEYYDKSILVAKEINDNYRLCYCYLSICEEKKYERKYQEALEYCRIATELAKDLEYEDFIASSIHVKAEIMRSLKNFNEALTNYDEAILIGRKIKESQIIHNSLVGKAMTYYDMGDYKKSKALSEEAINEAEALRLSNRIRDAAEVVYKSSEMLMDYKSAYKNYRKFVAMKDTINNLEQTKKFASIEYKAKEDNLKAEQEVRNKIHKSEQEKKEQEIVHQKFIRNLFIFGSIVLFILIFVIFRSLQENRRKNKIISAQKAEVEQKNKLIEKQKALVEEKQKELLDSIHYAKRIQRALIPSEKYIKSVLTRMQSKK